MADYMEGVGAPMGWVAVRVEEYRDIIERMFTAKTKLEAMQTKWADKYNEATRLAKEVEKLEEDVADCMTFICNRFAADAFHAWRNLRKEEKTP